MKRITYILLVISLSIGQINAQIKRTPIAVVGLEASGISESEAKTLTNRLQNELFSIGIFDIMEREKMDEILKEQGFYQTGCISNECIIEIGKIIGVKHIVGGSIGKLGMKYLLNVRLIQVETGRILATATEECTCQLEELTLAMDKVALKLSGIESRERITIKYTGNQSKKGKGNFYIKSYPSGAKVYLNQILQEGYTPMIVEDIPVNEYLIRAESGDYAAEFMTTLNVNEFQAVDLKLSKKVGRLRILTNTPKADVYLDNQFRGKTPFLIDTINVGTYQIKVKKSGYIEYFHELTIENAKETIIDIELKQPGPLKILSVPLEAKVIIDGDVKGETPIVIIGLNPGEHRLELLKSRYLPFVKQIIMLTAEETKLEPTLIPEKINNRNISPGKEKRTSGKKLDRVVKWIIIGSGAAFVGLTIMVTS